MGEGGRASPKTCRGHPQGPLREGDRPKCASLICLSANLEQLPGKRDIPSGASCSGLLFTVRTPTLLLKGEISVLLREPQASGGTGRVMSRA